MPAFPTFGKKADDNAVDDEQQQATLLANLEKRLTTEMKRLQQETRERFEALEQRVAVLERKQELGSKAALNLEDRVTTLEGILKKAEEAGKRRRGQQPSRTTSAAAAGAAATLTRSRSLNRTPSRGRGLGRTASGRNLPSQNSASDDDEQHKSVDEHGNPVDAAGNPVVTTDHGGDETPAAPKKVDCV